MGVIDITGQKFGRLRVLEYVGNNEKNYAMFRCKCDCGNETVVKGRNLRTGHTQSCGCYCKERSREAVLRYKITHGKTGSRLYIVWESMKKRCYNPKNKSYGDYGGRGITVCEEWINDFQAFFDWSMKNGYDQNADFMQCTIDRIDYDKGYSPDNCRWVSISVQAFNRRQRQSKSGIRGVGLTKSGKYAVSICKDGKRYNLGTYADVKDAIDVRQEAEMKYYGVILN